MNVKEPHYLEREPTCITSVQPHTVPVGRGLAALFIWGVRTHKHLGLTLNSK